MGSPQCAGSDRGGYGGRSSTWLLDGGNNVKENGKVGQGFGFKLRLLNRLVCDSVTVRVGLFTDVNYGPG